MDAWCALYVKGYVSCGAFVDHVSRWHAVSREAASPVLFVTYEELKQNPAKGVRKIADHLGLERSDEDINAVVRLSSFDAMRAQADKAPRPGDARNAKYATLTNGAVDSKSASSHLRQGGAGTWVQPPGLTSVGQAGADPRLIYPHLQLRWCRAGRPYVE